MKIENGVLSKIMDEDIIDGKVIIPTSVKSIGRFSFFHSNGLKFVHIPNSVIEIEEFAFSYCKSLESIDISDSIIKIGEEAFGDCKKLQSKKGNYKAFEKGLTCRDMQFIPNEWNTVEKEIELFDNELLYVTNLFDIFNDYYGNLEEDFEIWEVEVGNNIVGCEYDSTKNTNAILPKHKLTREEIINILNNK